MARLFGQAVLIDFNMPLGDVMPALDAKMKRLELQFHRMDFQKVVADTVVDQAVFHSSKAPAASWRGRMLRAKTKDQDRRKVNMAS